MLEIRRCTNTDIANLRAANVEGIRHHEECFAAQAAGWCDYLLAIDREGKLLGRVVVRNHSKYEPVITRLGELPEIQALGANPTGMGTGSALLDAAEAFARTRGAASVGLAVNIENHDAHRLYVRRGYLEWDGGLVIDEWDQIANDGTVVAHHREVCTYLVRPLRG